MSQSFFFWIVSASAGIFGLNLISRDLNVWANSVGVASERRKLKKVNLSLREIEESLAAGLIPAQEKWLALAALPEPWGALSYNSLTELRTSGAALLPTLRRLRALAQEHEAALMDAKARSAQALSQAVLCAALVPGFGAILYVLLPGVDEHPYQWAMSCALAIAMASLGSALMLKLSTSARWAGLSEEHRPWILAAQCAGERFLALVRAGTPADLSWTKSAELLQQQAPALAVRWGFSVWTDPPFSPLPKSTAAQALIEFGTALKRSVQVSVMEGRPCGDRVETSLQALRQELRSQIDRELNVLPTRALRPLFLFVAPSILGILFFGLWLSWSQVSSGIGGGIGGGGSFFAL
jgi:hypothetical protein